MGTFEKLGILVIVVIIVMILAVAISQWGGMGADGLDGVAAGAVPGEVVEEPLTIREIPAMGRPPAETEEKEAGVDTWPGGVPKVHTIRPGDKVWNLAVKDWGLKETFIAAIAAANPRANMRLLRTGERLVIPDPRPYFRTKAESRPGPRPDARTYEVQAGDTLELIAQKHLGSKARWPEILAINPGLKPHRLTPGQVVYVPVR